MFFCPSVNVNLALFEIFLVLLIEAKELYHKLSLSVATCKKQTCVLNLKYARFTQKHTRHLYIRKKFIKNVLICSV